MTDSNIIANHRPRAPKLILDWLRSDMRASIASAYLVALLFVAIFAPLIAPYPATEQNLDAILLAPSPEHLLGTDDLGRDVLSRLIFSAPAALYASLLAVGTSIVIGIPVGIVAGFFGGWVDSLISRLIDTLLSFPGIVLAIGVTGALGIGLTNAMLAVGIVYAPYLARLARAQTFVVKNELYVDVARCLGASYWRIVTRHIMPNAIQPLIVQVTLLLAIALLAEASLSFLGLGVQPPQPSWGSMLARGYIYMEIAPEQMYAPGLAIVFTTLAFNALGESMRTLWTRR